jgi:CubicO group peptidase (beta-lactamase class C family)
MKPLPFSPWLFAAALAALAGPPALADDLPQTGPEQVGLSPARLGRMDALLDRAVRQKHIAGAVALLMRHGKVAYFRPFGQRDAETHQPMTPDTIFRIASMTKPVTSVAVLILVDEGKLRLTDPVSKYLPEFKTPRVLVPGRSSKRGDFRLVPAERGITVHDLLTHTSGLTYRFFGRPHLAELYRKAGVSDGLAPTEGTIADEVKRLAGLPLLCQPGRAWEYGLSTDVLGRLVEVVSGKDLATFFRERIFEPLRMRDTYFFLPAGKRDRLAALYRPGPDRKIVRVGEEPVQAGALVYSAALPYRGPRTYFSGGAGLVSTAADYARFLRMLQGGGKAGGARLLKPETVRRMTRNQVGNLRPWIREHGDGFGYGFGVVTAGQKDRGAVSPGTYSWGGIYNTYFWVDPHKQLIGILMTQIYPSNHLTLRRDFQKLAYEALTD